MVIYDIMARDQICETRNYAARTLASFPGHFFAGEEKTAWYNLFAHVPGSQNLGILDMLVYFPLVSTVVLRNMSVFVS